MTGRGAMPPHLAGLTGTRRKVLPQERRLADLNQLLAPTGAMLEAGLDRPAWPPVFILGPPRGGTTVTSQLLASTGLFGMVTNFAARFWKAPALGMRIQRAIGLCGGSFVSSYRSDHGLTEGWCEPNEFGYFWSGFFDLGQESHALGAAERSRFDSVGLRRAVAAMEREAGRPMAFKNNTWFTLNADLVADVFPGCVLAACERDPFFVAQSLWRQRLALHGDPAVWWSVRPPDHAAIAALEPLEQVAAQAVSIAAGMRASLARAAGARIARLPYADVAAAPREAISDIATLAGIAPDTIAAALPGLPERLNNTDRVTLAPALAARLRRFVDDHAVRRPELRETGTASKDGLQDLTQ